MLAAQSWVGSVPTWALLFVALAAAWRVTKGGGGAAVSELSEANKVLTETVERQRAKLEESDKQIAELKGKTDFAVALVGALTPINEWTSGHERRAQERHEAVMKLNEQEIVLLGMIADRMPGDPNGH